MRTERWRIQEKANGRVVLSENNGDGTYRTHGEFPTIAKAKEAVRLCERAEKENLIIREIYL